MPSSLRKVTHHWIHPTRTSRKQRIDSTPPHQTLISRVVRVASLCISMTVAPRLFRTSQTTRTQTWPPVKATAVEALSILSRNVKRLTLKWITPSVIFRQSSQTILVLIISNDKSGIHGGIFSQTNHVNIGNVIFVFILLLFTFGFFLYFIWTNFLINLINFNPWAGWVHWKKTRRCIFFGIELQLTRKFLSHVLCQMAYLTLFHLFSFGPCFFVDIGLFVDRGLSFNDWTTNTYATSIKHICSIWNV